MATRRRKKLAKGLHLDKSQRWRIGSKWVSKDVVKDALALMSPEQVGQVLAQSARAQGRSKKQRTIIYAKFDGVGERSISHSEMGLKYALQQAASWIGHIDENVKEIAYLKLTDKDVRKKLRRGERVNPRVVDLQVVRLDSTPWQEKKAKKAKKAKRRKKS